VLDNVPICLARHTLDIARFGLVYRVEECGKRVAEAEASPAAVADIENAL
jgi:hypothetical protein